MAKRVLCAAIAVLLLALAGCTPFASQNINDLLRAPALGQGQDEIQKALVAYLGGQEPQYKFPREGDWLSPLLRADLNGDGREEAILLYSVADIPALARDKGNNVYVALLEHVDGAWTVTRDQQGLSTDVASLGVTNLLGDDTRQLVVGYATATYNTKTLAVYVYRDELRLMFQYDYSRYEVGDFTGRGGQDMAVVSRDDEPGTLRLRFIPTQDGHFVTGAAPEVVPLDENFVSCSGILPSISSSPEAPYERLLVIDGVTSISTGALTSQFVYYQGGRFFTTSDSNPLRGVAARRNPLLRSRDIDGDGVVEIPLSAGRAATINLEDSLEYVKWMDFTAGEAEPLTKQYGLVDSTREIYVRLPDAWRDEVIVADGSVAGEWQIQNRRSRAPLVSLRDIEVPPPGALLVPGTDSTYLQIHSGVGELAREAIFVENMEAN